MNPEEVAVNIVELQKKLEKYEFLGKYDKDDKVEADTLAHAFSDLEESFRVFLDELLPRLKEQDLDEEGLNDLLLDIGEEFRHILYHIQDPSFYQYLYDSDD